MTCNQGQVKRDKQLITSLGSAAIHPCLPHMLSHQEKKVSVSAQKETRFLSHKTQKKKCLEGESNSHLRITQAMLGHIDDRYETFVLAVILSRLDVMYFV